MISLHHWLVALGRGLKRYKHKRRIEEEARRDRLKLEAYREQTRAEALVEVERRGMMGGRPPAMRLRRYHRSSPPKRLEAESYRPSSSSDDPTPSFSLPPSTSSVTYDPPAASMPDPSPSFDPGGGSSGGGGADGSW
jgi:uncharacterized membrane protein YgcG